MANVGAITQCFPESCLYENVAELVWLEQKSLQMSGFKIAVSTCNVQELNDPV